ncbi:PilW family protein [Chitinilyticum litopenaei]|uniref:PilW family protein n=1 Tax=Chitinilyticum litopenaei TaxID=1121276 RepID=UPI0003F56B65|nr:prepilin-type N-terminal cleavage/methylation domain-containing protein [Chitinilyticum litopenaei]
MIKQSGLTIIELLVATAIASILLLTAASIGFSNINASKSSIKLGNQQNSSENMLGSLSNELMRAGYNKNAEDPKAPLFRKIWLFGGSDATNRECVIFRYDRYDASGEDIFTTPIPDLPPGDGSLVKEEIRGIRFDRATRQVQFLTAAENVAVADCNYSTIAEKARWSPVNNAETIRLASFKINVKSSFARDGSGWYAESAELYTKSPIDKSVDIRLCNDISQAQDAADLDDIDSKCRIAKRTIELRNRPYIQ